MIHATVEQNWMTKLEKQCNSIKYTVLKKLCGVISARETVQQLMYTMNKAMKTVRFHRHQL